jgi:hypothetical protein
MKAVGLLAAVNVTHCDWKKRIFTLFGLPTLQLIFVARGNTGLRLSVCPSAIVLVLIVRSLVKYLTFILFLSSHFAHASVRI